MALKHRAFIFDENNLFKDLERIPFTNVENFSENLYHLTRKLATNAEGAMLKVLPYIRYDEEWFDRSDPEIYKTSGWFLVYLTSKLRSAPDLSSSQPTSFTVLERILQQIGWSEKDISHLIYGEPLSSIVNLSKNPIIASAISFHQYQGGWLSNQDVSLFYYKLREIQEMFYEPQQRLFNSVSDLAAPFYLQPGEIIRKTFVDVLFMLLYAIDNKSALFLIVD